MDDLLLADELRGEFEGFTPLAARAAQDEGIAAILDDRIRHRAAVGARNLADLLVKDVLTIGVVVDLARPLVADALARAVGRSPRDAAALPPREDLDVQKILRHRAVRRRAACRRHGCPNRAKAQIVKPHALQQTITRGASSRCTLTGVLRRRTRVTDQAREELRRWLDVSSYTRRFESRHVLVASLQWDDGPGIATGREHEVHEEAAHPSVPVMVRVDVHEYEMPQDHANGGLLFPFEQFEQCRHELADGFVIRRHVHGASDVDGSTAISGQAGGFHNAGCHTRSKQFSIPGAVIFGRRGAGVLAGQHLLYALLDELKGLPVAACSHGVALIPVGFDAIGVPVPRANALDQFGTDTVAFYRQGVVGISDVDGIHLLEVGGHIGLGAWWGRKDLHDGLAHLFPHHAQTVDVGGGFSRWKGDGWFVFERIGFVNRETRRPP